MEEEKPNDKKYRVKITGQINKEEYFDKPKVSTKEIAEKLNIDRNTIFNIDGKTVTPGTMIDIDKEPEIECKEVSTDS